MIFISQLANSGVITESDGAYITLQQNIGNSWVPALRMLILFGVTAMFLAAAPLRTVVAGVMSIRQTFSFHWWSGGLRLGGNCPRTYPNGMKAVVDRNSRLCRSSHQAGILYRAED
jgi:hypothetical protein